MIGKILRTKNAFKSKDLKAFSFDGGGEGIRTLDFNVTPAIFYSALIFRLDQSAIICYSVDFGTVLFDFLFDANIGDE